MSVKPIPDGFHSITPYVVVDGAEKLIEFLKKAFDGRVQEIVKRPDGGIGHAEVRIGDSVIMLGDPMGGWKPMPGSFYVYIEDCDTVYKRALGAGAVAVMPLENQFYGDRCGSVRDSFGNHWSIATRIENVSKEEMKRRAQEAFQKAHA